MNFICMSMAMFSAVLFLLEGRYEIYAVHFLTANIWFAAAAICFAIQGKGTR